MCCYCPVPIRSHLADSAVHNVDLMDRLVAVYDDFTRTEDVTNDMHGEFAEKGVRHVLEQRNLHAPPQKNATNETKKKTFLLHI